MAIHRATIPDPPRRQRRHLLALGLLLGLVLASTTSAETLSVQSEFVRRLRQPHSALVQGKEFRDALRQVAQAESGHLQINLWIDRKVNPNLQVYPGALGPTRFASLSKIAEAANCVCHPVDGCVLIGRAEWVDWLVAGLPRKSRGSEQPVDVRWPDFTTPSEALQQVGVAQSDATLPHDLWPNSKWTKIRPTLAERLIRGQFLATDRAPPTYARAYRFANTKPAEASILQAEPTATFKRTGGDVVLTGSGTAHRRFVAACLSDRDGSQRPSDAVAALAKDKRTFKLEVESEMAGAIVKQLAGVAQIECDFDPDANQQLRKLVTFTVKDKTLWEIIQQVGRQADLRFESVGAKLRVTAGVSD